MHWPTSTFYTWAFCQQLLSCLDYHITNGMLAMRIGLPINRIRKPCKVALTFSVASCFVACSLLAVMRLSSDIIESDESLGKIVPQQFWLTWPEQLVPQYTMSPCQALQVILPKTSSSCL